MSVKKPKKVTVREWETIREEVKQMAEMSCRPTLPKYRMGDVIDENQTVKWNREEVARRNALHGEEVIRLNTEKNRWRDKLYEEIYNKIVIELQGKVDLKGAAKIFNYAYERGHANGVYEVFIHLMDLLDLFSEVVIDMKGGE